MHLTCNQCNHEWDEEVEDGSQVVMCPSCLAIVPVVLAGGRESVLPETQRPAEAKDSTTVGGDLAGHPTTPPPPTKKVTATPEKTKPVARTPKPATAAADSESDPLIGRTLGGYRIEKILGRGGITTPS